MKKEKILHAIAEVDKLAEIYNNEASHFDGLGRHEDAKHRRAQASGMLIAVEKIKEFLKACVPSGRTKMTIDCVMKKAYKLAVQEQQNYRNLLG